MTPDLRDLEKGSLYLKYDESLLDVLKITFMLQKGRMFLNDRIRLFLTYADDVPMKGSIIETSIFGTVCTGSLVLLIMLKNLYMQLSTNDGGYSELNGSETSVPLHLF